MLHADNAKSEYYRGNFFFLQKAGAGYTMLAAFIPAWTISRVCIGIMDWGT